MAPGSSVTRNTSASGLSCGLRRKALAGRDGGNARGAEIGPDEAGPHQPEVRGDQQPFDLLVGIVGQREDDPVRLGARLLGADLDAANDAVGARRRGDLDAVTLAAVAFDHGGQVDGRAVQGHANRFDGASGPAQRQTVESEGEQKK